MTKQYIIVEYAKKDKDKPTILRMQILEREKVFSYIQDKLNDARFRDIYETFAIYELGKLLIDTTKQQGD